MSQGFAKSQHSDTRIALADDDVLLREGLTSLLERAGFEVAGSVGTGDALLDLVREQIPDLVIVDIRMPPQHSTEGLEAAAQIRREFPEIGVLVLSAHAEVEQAMDLIASGRRVGYLLKSRVVDIESFIETVERIVAGGRLWTPPWFRSSFRRGASTTPLMPSTEREREVLSLMAEGYSNAGIAHRLFVAEGTVEKHVRSILSKLQLPETQDDHRRVLAVLTFLESR